MEFGFLASLAITLFALFALFIVSLTYDTALKVASNPKVDGGSLAEIRAFVFTIPATLAIAATGATEIVTTIGNHVSTNQRTYIILVLFVTSAVVISQVGDEIIQAVDTGFSAVGYPLISEIVEPISNLLRMGYDFGICWVNIAIRFTKTITATIQKNVFDCLESEPRVIFTALASFLEELLFAIIKFILGTETLPTTTFDPLGLPPSFDESVVKFGEFFTTLGGPVACSCNLTKYLGFDMVDTTLNYPNFAPAVGSSVRAVYWLIQPVVVIVMELILAPLEGRIIFECPPTNTTEGIFCKVSRPPKFDRLADELCYAVINMSYVVDAIPATIVNQFITDALPENGLPLTALAGTTFCVITQYGNVVLDVLLHTDLIFDSEVRYLQYGNYSRPLEFAYLTSGAVERFLVFIENLIGGRFEDERLISCPVVSAYNATIGAGIFFSDFLKQMFTNITEVPDFVRDYNYTAIEGPYSQLWSCLGEFFSVQPLLEAGEGLSTSLLHLFVNFIADIKTTFESFDNFVDYLDGDFRTDYTDVLINAVNFTVQVDNILRGFDDNCTPYTFDVINDTTGEPVFGLPAVEEYFMCCTGDLVALVLQVVLKVFDSVLNFVINILVVIKDSGDSASIEDMFLTIINDLSMVLDTLMDEVMERLECVIASPFAYVQCKAVLDSCTEEGCNALDCCTLASQVQPLLDTFRIVYQVLVHIILDILRYIYDLVTDNGGDASTIFCTFTISVYDGTVGFTIRFFFAIIDILACIFDALDGIAGNNGLQATVLSLFVYEEGTPDCDNSHVDDCGIIKHIICDLVSHLITIIEAIVQLLSGDFEGFVGTIFGSIGAPITPDQIACVFRTTFNNLAQCWDNAIVHCHAGVCFPDFAQMIDCVLEIVTDIENAVTSCVGSRRNIERALLISPTINITITNSSHPCYPIFQTVNNETLDENLRLSLIPEMKKCIFYVAIAEATNNYFEQEVVPLNTFYDIGSFFAWSQRLMSESFYIGGWLLRSDQNMTWEMYAVENNVTYPITLKMGEWIQSLLNLSNIQDWPLVKALKKVIDQYNVVYQSYQARKHVYTRENLVERFENVTWDPMLVKMYTYTSENTAYIYERISNKMYDKIHNVSPDKMKRRVNLLKVGAMIETGLRVHWMKEERENVHEKVQERWDAQLGSYLHVGKRSDPVDICDYVSQDVCDECTLLTDIINVNLNDFMICVETHQAADFNPENTFIMAPDRVVHGWELNFITDYPFQEKINRSSEGAQVVSTIFSPVKYFFGLDVLDGMDSGATFLTYINSTDPNSWLYWLLQWRVCDMETDLTCRLAPTGYGLIKGTIIAIGSYLVITAVFVKLIESSSSFLLLLWATLPFAILRIGYNTSIGCFPALPDCLADDVYSIIKFIDRPCIDWDPIFPNITEDECSSGFSRQFVDCEADPYNFDDRMFVCLLFN